MQRPATKQSTRAANAKERAFMAWARDQPCCECGCPSPSIVDHMYGSAFIHNKVLIGHWAVLPYCIYCDRVKTLGSHNAYFEVFGRTQAQAWEAMILNNDYWACEVNVEVWDAIMDWGK